MQGRGGAIVHLDATLICEAPKIEQRREAMRARIAEIAGVDAGRVAVKATTSEKPLHRTRRGHRMPLATATVRLPPG